MFRHHGMHPSIRFVENGDGGGGGNSGDDGGGGGKNGDENAEGRDGKLGENGEDALRKEREARRKADSEVRRLKAAEKELADLKAAGATDAERAVAQARAEGAAEAAKAANDRILRAEARAFAGALDFREPDKAVRLLDLDTVHVGDDGAFDEDAVKNLLKDLAKESPYLVKNSGEEGEEGRGGGGRRDADARRMGAGGRSGGTEPTDTDGRLRAGLAQHMR